MQPSANENSTRPLSSTVASLKSRDRRTRPSWRNCHSLRNSCYNHEAWHSAVALVLSRDDGGFACTTQLRVSVSCATSFVWCVALVTLGLCDSRPSETRNPETQSSSLPGIATERHNPCFVLRKTEGQYDVL